MTARTGRHAARRPGAGRRGWALLAAGALAVLAVSPTGATQAGWTDREEVVLPAVTTDRVGLMATPPTAPVVSGATATTSTTVTNTAQAAALTGGPASVTARPGVRTTPGEAAAVLAGLTIGYGADCAAAPQWTAGPTTGSTRAVTGTPSTLAPGATTTLCQTTTAPDALIRSHGARAVTLTTALAGAVPGTPAWAGTAVMSTDVRVPFPQATGLTCTSGSIEWLREHPAQLTWSWAGSTAVEPAVARWEVLTQEHDGRWTVVDESVSGTLTASIYRSDIGVLATQAFKVRAYPFAANGGVDRSVYVESDQVVRIQRPVLGAATCAGVSANTSATAVSLGVAS